MPQALSYFGRSVDGRLDLDGDDLVDVAVGAQGAAILLRWAVAAQAAVDNMAQLLKARALESQTYIWLLDQLTLHLHSPSL